MDERREDVRHRMLEKVLRFVRDASRVPGVCSISRLGSITTPKANPKDVDLLVVVSDAADLAPIAARGRQLEGRLQSLNHGADIFLANESGRYLGRTCSWRECRPGIRASCHADNCGRRPYLNDDLSSLRLSAETVAKPAARLWPQVERRCPLPADVDACLRQLGMSPHTAFPAPDAGAGQE